MCGLCGEFRFDQSVPSRDRMQAMLRPLERRGPDDEGLLIDGSVGLAHRRLSIIDLSQRAHQPMVDEQAGLSLVFNGAIYNYPQLRQELIQLGHSFESSGDTEVILRAYAQWGEDCVARLHGMFAFVIHDKRTQSLFLARDRMGIKPLYYSQTENAFRFASNMQSLLASGEVDTRFDPVALHHQFTLHAVVPAPRTIFQGVRKLEPGHWMRIDAAGKVSKHRYWFLNATRFDQPRSEAQWIEAIHDALMGAVEKRKTIADVPVGVLLSGGLDSSLLVALLAEAGVDDLRTFSIGFEDKPEEKGSEFEYSDQVVDRYQTRHQKFLIPNEQVLQRLPEAVRAMSEPMFGQDAVAFYLLSELVSQHVKVVQSGQGADEVFGGYFWYPKMRDAMGSPLDRFRQHYFDRDHDEFLQMMQPAYQVEDVTGHMVQECLTQEMADEYIDQVLRFDVTTLIVDDPVKRVDNMTMAWGLEARVPFLDHELVELAARMPPGLKLASGGKHILKCIARGRLPDAVIDRPKGYFPVPALKYVRGEFRDFMADILNSRAALERGVFRRSYVDKLLAEPDQHFTRILGSKLWHLALFEFWLQENLDGTLSH